MLGFAEDDCSLEACEGFRPVMRCEYLVADPDPLVRMQALMEGAHGRICKRA